MPGHAQRVKGIDPIRLNREIAYKGDIGQRRRKFCVKYIEKKKGIIKELQADQIRAAAKDGETITCPKGCAYCCLLYMQASVQECEAIVYHLYQNEFALATFLENYKDWRKRLRKNGDIFKKCAQTWLGKNTTGAGTEEFRAFAEETKRYQGQNIPCPFLHNNLCLIYEVRPFTCVGTVASTTPEWCNPSNSNKPKIYWSRTSAVIDKSFYYKEIDGVVLAFMPIMVYGILEDGYKMLSIVTGLKDLEKKALAEPQVKAVMESFT
ncbi:hypothetical protein ACFLUX_02705 [Chloroflexota bacterium]